MSRQAVEGASPLIKNQDDLRGYFLDGAKSQDRFKVGLEIEHFLVESASGRPVQFSGTQGVETFLNALSELDPWERVQENGRTIALMWEGSAITLEPGGQVEISSATHGCLASLAQEMTDRIRAFGQVLEKRGQCFMRAGVHPIAGLEDLEWVPRDRYDIMRQYLGEQGTRAHDMMKRTASIQVNLDYQHEAHASDMMKLGTIMAPLTTALTASGCIEHGRWTKDLTPRTDIWRKTDADRCKTPDFFWNGQFGFDAYLEHALDVPMFFIVRDGKFISKTHETFRTFLESSEPTYLSDFDNHLTTLFPDVRLKQHIEFRAADSCRLPLALALTTFWMGAVYEEKALAAILAKLKDLPMSELDGVMQGAGQDGLSCRWGGRTLTEIWQDILPIAKLGYLTWSRQEGHDIDETLFDAMERVIQTGESPAKQLRKSYGWEPGAEVSGEAIASMCDCP